MTEEVSEERNIRDLELDLLKSWEALEPFVLQARRQDEPVEDSPLDEQGKAISIWENLFKEEIGEVRQARDAVAHLPGSVQVEDLVQAKEFADRLITLLESRLKNMPDLSGSSQRAN